MEGTDGKFEQVEADFSVGEMVNRINQWGLDRNITAEGGATVMSQMSKMTEEFAEFLQTWDRYAFVDAKVDELVRHNDWAVDDLEEELVGLKVSLEDDFGDILVCLINAMRLAGTDMETCLAKAWDDIKDRKGRMENGKFIKQSSNEST